MLPFQIFSSNLEFNDKTTEEVRALELWSTGFTFRLADDLREDEISHVHVSFFDFSGYHFHTISLNNFQIFQEEETEFYRVYRLECHDELFCEHATLLMKEYSSYISLKLGEGGDLSQELIGYPAELDEVFPESYEKALSGWMRNDRSVVEAAPLNISEREISDDKISDDKISDEITSDEIAPDIITSDEIAPDKIVSDETASDKIASDEKVAYGYAPERLSAAVGDLAVELLDEELWNQYLDLPLDVFWRWYKERNHLMDHPVGSRRLRRIYVGNPYCGRLFPKRDVLEQILFKANMEGLFVTLVFAPFKEQEIEDTRRLFAHLRATKRGLEFEINDWGMLRLAQEYHFPKDTILLGRMLCKRRRDVRTKYLGSREIWAKAASGVRSEFFREYLRQEFGVSRLDEEEDGICHAPFYQMNTAGLCTLYAACENGGRGNQAEPPQGCEKVCKESCFLYPEHLEMTGRYNSLFGFDADALTKSCERLVLNFM